MGLRGGSEPVNVLDRVLAGTSGRNRRETRGGDIDRGVYERRCVRWVVRRVGDCKMFDAHSGQKLGIR